MTNAPKSKPCLVKRAGMSASSGDELHDGDRVERDREGRDVSPPVVKHSSSASRSRLRSALPTGINCVVDSHPSLIRPPQFAKKLYMFELQFK